MGETRRRGVQWCNRSLRCDPYRFHDKKSHRLSEFSRIITVRSDLSGAATPESSYPEPGFFFLLAKTFVNNFFVSVSIHNSFFFLSTLKCRD